MPTHLYLAPAAAGKTAYVLQLALEAARGLAATPRIVVPTHLQARAARLRLAEMGGAIGVRVLTFDGLYAEILNAAGEVYTELSDPVQFRLIRALLDALPLHHYAPLANRPGFVAVLQRLIGEMKAARIYPDAFTRAVAAMGAETRLTELALIYTAYQERLAGAGWADRAGLGWLAVEALESRAPVVGSNWSLVVVDGFDNFTPVQTALLQALAGRVAQMVVTLTGTPDMQGAPAQRRFERTHRLLEEALGVAAESLPGQDALTASVLAALARRLLDAAAAPEPVADEAAAIELIEAPDRAAEVRAALRRLKAHLLVDGYRPGEVALLARDIAPYRPYIRQTAAEFGLPIRLMDGMPLRENPAIAALMNLLALMTPDSSGAPALLRRAVIEAWRAPYFDWSALPAAGAGAPIGIAPGDSDRLDVTSRRGRVIGGQAQWAEAFDHLAAATQAAEDGDDERGAAAGLPRGEEAARLRETFARFVERLTPPSGPRPYREFVAWLETLIGEDERGPASDAVDPTSLRVAAQARAAGDEAIEERDIAALIALKDVLRGLVWAEEALTTEPVAFAEFVTELSGIIEAATYSLPPHADREEVLVADVVQARGLPFRAVAVLGLAEGEFPATLHEDPFLRDADRSRLRLEFGLPLEPSTASSEAELFYETVTRPRERLLLTRARIADNGAPWQASPHWEAVRRLAPGAVVEAVGEGARTAGEAASWPELLECLARDDEQPALRAWCDRAAPAVAAGVGAGVMLLRARQARDAASPFDGDLSALEAEFADRFGPRHIWSASRLETYRSCPFHFFIANVLGLEPREEPAEGLDARQLGTIYHRIFELLYRAADPADADGVLAALPAIADAVLEDAPRSEGFRATAWWARTRAEITANVRRSVEALAALPGGFLLVASELYFDDALVMLPDGESFRLHGFIDRVDRAPDGRLRIIDYKTAGSSGFDAASFARGKKIQLALYAAAAEQLPEMGQVAEGFYWHVRQAEQSGFTLASHAGGPGEAMKAAAEFAWVAVSGARAGRFAPHPPDDGCPSYCPALAFCGSYRPGFGGRP